MRKGEEKKYILTNLKVLVIKKVMETLIVQNKIKEV